IWGPMNFLVFEGLRRYPELNDVAGEFARKSLSLLLKEWRENSHVHENYNGTTGEGCDSKSSDPNYHWGALLSHIALEQLIDVEAFGRGGLRFGCGLKNAGKAENVQLAGHRYSVSLRTKLEVYEDGELLLETLKPTTIRNFLHTGKGIEFDVDAPTAVQLNVCGHADVRPAAGKFRAFIKGDRKGQYIAAFVLPKGMTHVEARREEDKKGRREEGKKEEEKRGKRE
ncbi:MAG TPA: hypothetical protein VM186_05400, partial [Planctomycetota bacterium]|nr:hypothetical protein [Planctomycetota bacterium]